MAFESSTIMRTADPAMVAGDINDLVRPGLLALGAMDVRVGVAMTGPMMGMYAVSSRWETLDAWSVGEAAMTGRMRPGGDLAETAVRYAPVQRIIAKDVLEVGDATGRYLSASRFSYSTSPQGLEHGSQIMLDAGVNGMRALSVIAGGEMTGHLIAASFVDSLDTLSDALAATVADAQFVANSAAGGAKLESRTIFRIL